MDQIEVTSLSSKGQVVIPNGIRNQMNLKEGTKLMVFSDGQNVLLKPIQVPKKETFKSLIQKSRALAKANGITKADVKVAIKKVRSESRY